LGNDNSLPLVRGAAFDKHFAAAPLVRAFLDIGCGGGENHAWPLLGPSRRTALSWG